MWNIRIQQYEAKIYSQCILGYWIHLAHKIYLMIWLVLSLVNVEVGLGLWCLTPLSAIFQFYWWRKLEKTTDSTQVTEEFIYTVLNFVFCFSFTEQKSLDNYIKHYEELDYDTVDLQTTHQRIKRSLGDKTLKFKFNAFKK